MEKIDNAQLVEFSQCENTGSEQADYEEDASTADNSDTQTLRIDSPISLTEKTDEDKIIHNIDNSLNSVINSPKAALLGKLKAKQRLQAFLLPKQNPFLNSPTKKIEDIQIPTKSDKNAKKPKQSPIEKAKSIIEELEEIKKVENAKQLLVSPLFKERKPTYKEKHYRRKSRSRSLEPVRKPIEKGRYPESWQEMKNRKLSLEDVQEIRFAKVCKNTKQQDNCHDFRKQLLFELPPQPLSSLKFKGVGGQDKTVPSQYIRFTKELPSLSYSINHYKNKDEHLSTLEIYNYIPKPHLDIITKLKADSTKFTEETPKKDVRKWYSKQMLGNIGDGCELLEKSLGLSILQSYMDEEEDDDKNGVNLTCKEISEDDQGTDFSKTAEETQHEDQVNLELKDLESFSPVGNENIQLVEKEEINNMESEGEKIEVENPRKKKKPKDKKDKKYKRKKDKKTKKEMRRRKRKKTDKEKDVKEVKKKSSKSDKKNDKKNEGIKEAKSKKKDNTKADKKIDSDEKKKHSKENKEKEVTKMDNIFTELESDIKKEKFEDKKSNKRDKSADDKKTEDHKKTKKSSKKEHKKHKNKQLNLTVPLYYDELESIRGRSLSKERDKNIQEKSRESSRESKKTKDSSKVCCKKSSKKSSEKDKEKTKDKPSFDFEEIITVKVEEEKKVKTEKFEKIEKQSHHREPEKIKREDLFEIEPLNSGEGLGTPDTEEYHSHWESDEDVRNVISYSPLLPLKLNSSWESDEDIPSPEKTIHDRYSEQSSRNTERRSRKYFDGERSLEMPLNIVNLSRKEQRKSGKSSDFPDRKFLSNDTRLRYEEDSWERGEFLKMCNDIEGEKLRHERKTLSEERRMLEWEKRKLAEKLEKRTYKRDIFDNLEDTIVKEVTYEKIHGENEEIYLKSTDYILNNRKPIKSNDHSIQKKYDHKSRKRTRSTEDHKHHTPEDNHKQHKHDKFKKFKHSKLDGIDVKYEKDNLLKYDSTSSVSGDAGKDKMFLSNLKNRYKPSEVSSAKDDSRSSKYKCDKPKDVELSKVDLDSLVISDSKETSKSDILENEYEEFLKAVTGDIAKPESKSKERKSNKKTEIKKTKTKSSRRRKYSSSSSSSSTSSSSDSDDSDSSSSSSSSSSYSSSSTSSSEREKKRRKIKAKRKQKGKQKVKDREKPVKIEMTHSIVKNLDDLQAFPISKTPIIQIKQEQEDPGYSELPTVNSVVKDVDHTVPLPVPSPAIVPPPYLNLLPVKQEKAESVSSKADSTTSPAKKTALIPTKFVSPLPRRECTAVNAPHSSTLSDVPKKDDAATLINLNAKDVVDQPAISKSSQFSFSIANKRMAFGEGLDSDSQECKDFFANKKTICEEAAVVESSKSVNDEVILIKEPLSPPRKEASSSKSTKEESSSGEKPSPDIVLISSPKQIDISPNKNLNLKDAGKSSNVESSKKPSRKSLSPKHKNLSPRKTRDKSPLHRKTSRQSDEVSRRHSPKRRRSLERNDRRRSSPLRSKKTQSSRSRTLSSPRSRRSPSPKRRKSPSPRIQRSHSPPANRPASPRNRRSPFRNRSPNYRTSPPRKTYKRSYSRSPSPVRRKESIQKTLQRLAGMDDYLPPENTSPINSPVDGFKRSVADSTISDDQLLQQNSTEPFDSPAYRTSTKLVQTPPSPKRVPLDIRINQVLGLDKENPPIPITTVYTQTNHAQSYTYDQYSEQYGHYPQYNQNVLPKDNYVEQQSLPKSQPHVGSSKVVQIGNMLQVVPTEEAPPQDHKPPTQKIVQVGNMLQIVPTPSPHVTKEAPIPTPVHVSMRAVVQGDIPLGVLQPTLSMSQPPPPPAAPMDRGNLNSTSTHEKLSPEELMMQKIAERRAERAKRHEDREKKRNEKEKRRKEKERKKQLRLKIKTENMIKKALRIETEALAMGENMDDEENAMDVTPSCWPSISAVASSPLKPAGKGILITHGFSKLNIDEDSDQKRCKCVKFADGVIPGEGTSPSGGEELSSPPPPKEKRFKKIKKKKLQKKKKIKVKIIRKSSADSPDDEDLDNLPPPSPPPGSPPPHIFPARIKTHTNNNIHPSYATGVPLMPVGNYASQYRPTIPIAVPPPIHNLPPPAPRPPPQIMSPHVPPPVHGSMPHGPSPGVPHGIPNHPHGSMHHPPGPRV